MGPKKDKSTPWSRQPTKCGHCQVEMRRDRLGEHTREQHPGCKIKEYHHGTRSIADIFSKKPTASSVSSPTTNPSSDPHSVSHGDTSAGSSVASCGASGVTIGQGSRNAREANQMI